MPLLGDYAQGDRNTAARLNTKLNQFVVQSDYETLLGEVMSSHCVSGLNTTNTGTTIVNVSSGVIYLNGARYAINAIAGQVLPTNSDVYIDIGSDGTIDFNSVSNGASAPSIESGHFRRTKVVTNGSTVTSILKYTGLAYTPTLTAQTTNPTLGTGATSVGEYIKVGGVVTGKFTIKFGSSGTNAGSGAYFVAAPLPITNSGDTEYEPLGQLRIRDTSAAVTYTFHLEYEDANKFQLAYNPTLSTASSVSSSAPWAWAATDVIAGQFNYITEI